ncbi:hypothetical protein IID04_02785 [PVC group bacterium]|nr:hypothetical protein [PVC group bacterium]
MTPLDEKKLAQIKSRLPHIDETLIQNHIERLEEDYFLEFSDEDIITHIREISHLSTDTACKMIFQRSNKDFTITVIGFDTQGSFAVICGLLTSAGFNIQEGKSFTYSKSTPKTISKTKKPMRRSQARELARQTFYLERKKFITQLHCVHAAPDTLAKDFESQFQSQLNLYHGYLIDNKIKEVQKEINRLIQDHLIGLVPKNTSSSAHRLLPIDIQFEKEANQTVLHITGPDTPAYLFSLANALTLHGISIQKVSVKTKGAFVDDKITITDMYDRPLTQPHYLQKLKMAVASIKQFTHLLPLATDPTAAMHQFHQFIDDLMTKSNYALSPFDKDENLLMASLAKIFGARPHIWEDFIRMQHENLLPFLKNIGHLEKSKSKEVMLDELQNSLSKVKGFDRQVKAINEYKNEELFRIDLVHLIYPSITFIEFAEQLTQHAEAIISTTANLIYHYLEEQHGTPSNKDGSVCSFALFGLGKFGGQELGYASDLEIVFLYDENAQTNHSNNAIGNSVFFIKFVQNLLKALPAKNAGIFEIDLRLRPHGKKGPLASSLNRWGEYYLKDGGAYDYERQALIRLRPIYGNTDFCGKVMEIRDQIIYSESSISVKNSIEIRNKQILKNVTPGKINAKFSKGALTDIEYAIQYLQLAHAHQHPKLRTPNTIQAMEYMLETDILTPTEFEKLYNNYAFLRRVINALRMVRGNAKDLEIPDLASEEFIFLARNLGYVSKESQSAEDQLFKDIELTLKTTYVFYKAKFIEKKETAFEESGLPGLLLQKKMSENEVTRVLASLKVQDTKKIHGILKSLIQEVEDKNTLVAVLVLAERHIRRSPDPDKVIVNFGNFIIESSKQHISLKQLLYQPKYIEILITLFGFSDYLTIILTKNPQLLLTITNDRLLLYNKTHEHFASELSSCAPFTNDIRENLRMIQKYKNSETLRIGLRDIYLNKPFEQIVRELSDLADTIVDRIYRNILIQKDHEELLRHQSIIALGKLGSRELNYSSDIDLVFVHTGKDTHIKALNKVNIQLIQLLTTPSDLGQLFRVDTRLRPYGKSGTLSSSVEFYKKYYKEKAEGWEIQSWLRARCISGNFEMGEKLISQIQKSAIQPKNYQNIHASIKTMRQKTLKQLSQKDLLERDVKNGRGGIRTIEMIVLNLILQHSNTHPTLQTGNILLGLEKLIHFRIIEPEIYRTLKKSYKFLRTVEHRIQLLGLQQRHVLPDDTEELGRIAKRMGFEDRLDNTALDQFKKTYQSITEQIQTLSEKHLES